MCLNNLSLLAIASFVGLRAVMPVAVEHRKELVGVLKGIPAGGKTKI